MIVFDAIWCQIGGNLMKKNNRLVLKLDLIKGTMITLAFLVVLFPVNAEAYLDPTTGGFLIQLIIGGVTGLAVIYKFFGDKIKNIFKRSSEDNE
jgi:hypothetical protein